MADTLRVPAWSSDGAGNLYGTAVNGGATDRGSIFELSPTTGGGWTETVVHSFDFSRDRAFPTAGLVFDKAGNLYGATWTGGPGPYDGGAVFELSPQAGGGWKETLLHAFGGPNDGVNPGAALILDAAGNLYGTTTGGGTLSGGIAFELSPKAGGGWTEKVLHNFNKGGGDGTLSLRQLAPRRCRQSLRNHVQGRRQEPRHRNRLRAIAQGGRRLGRENSA